MTTLTGDRRDRTVAVRGRPVRVVLCIGPVVFALAFVSARTWGLDEGWATWWPAAAPGALAVAYLRGSVRRPANRALLVGAALLAIGVGSWVAHLLDGRHPPGDEWVPAGWALVDVAQAAVTGLVLAGRGGLRLRGTHDLARLVAAALAGAVVAGGIALLVVAPRLPDGVAVLWGVGVSRVFAVILLAPLAMALPGHPRRASGVERALLWGAATGTTLVVLAVPGMLPLAFLPAAVLVVAALRQTPCATAVLLVVVAAVVVVATERGDGPFARVGDDLAALLAQSYLSVGVVTVLTVMLVVSARDAALEGLDERDRFARSVLESVASGVLMTDADGRVLARNGAYRGLVADGETTGDRRGLWPGELDLVVRALDGEELRGVQTRVGSSGRSADLVAETRPVRSADGTLLGAVATFTDITDERAVQARLREAVAFQDAVLAASPDVIFVTDVATHRVVWASGTIEPTLGYTPSEVVELDRTSRLNLVHPDDVEALHAADAAASRLRDGEVWTVRVRMSTERGQQRWMSRRVTPFSRGPDGRVVQLLGVSRDVTDVVEVERRLTDAANRDPLTGALNRRALLERLSVLVTRVAEADSVTTPVLFCDLDGFKAVNDSLGHVAGDRLLTTVAERISKTLRDGDVLARAGGDEFVLLLEPPRGGLPDRSASPVGVARSRAEVLHRARTVGRRILDAVSRPVEVQGTRLTVTLSIGIALVRPGIGPDEVLRDADAAMYRAKSTGKNRMHVFEVAPERGHDGRVI